MEQGRGNAGRPRGHSGAGQVQFGDKTSQGRIVFCFTDVVKYGEAL
jgi:hypothetical protein